MSKENHIYCSVDEIPLFLRIEDVMSILDIGRNTAYDLVRCGAIRSKRIGKQLRIPKDAVIEYISSTN